MGLFGPSYTWEEIQRKNDLLDELQKENDRVLTEQRLMLENVGLEKGGNVGIDIGSFILPIVVTFLGIGFIFYIPYLFSQLQYLNEGDPIAVETLTMILSSMITWIIYLKKSLTDDFIENYKAIFKTNYIIVMVGLVLVDIVFFQGLSKMFELIIGIIFSLFFMAIWSALATLIGIFFIKSCKKIKYFADVNRKKKIIENSKLYSKICDSIYNNYNNIVRVKISYNEIDIITETSNICIEFNKENYSNLDYIGIYAMSLLLKKKYNNFKVKKVDNSIFLNNQELERQNKKIELSQKKQAKLKEKQEQEDIKKKREEKIKNGEDW